VVKNSYKTLKSNQIIRQHILLIITRQQNNIIVRFKFPRTVFTRVRLFCNSTQCHPVSSYWHFAGSCFLLFLYFLVLLFILLPLPVTILGIFGLSIWRNQDPPKCQKLFSIYISSNSRKFEYSTKNMY